MSKKILPGQSSEDFPSIQEKNLKLLTEVLKKKSATDALTELGKHDKETWININESIKGLNEFVSRGGTGAVVESLTTHLTDSITFILEEKLSPINNTLDTIIAEKLDPLFELLNPMINSLAEFIAGNATGAFFGALAGSLLGPIGTLVGGMVGAAIEGLIEWFILNWGEKPSDLIEEALGESLWEIVFPGGPEYV